MGWSLSPRTATARPSSTSTSIPQTAWQKRQKLLCVWTTAPRAEDRPTMSSMPRSTPPEPGHCMRSCAASGVPEPGRPLLEERRHALTEVCRTRGEDLVAVLERDHLLEAARIQAQAEALLREPQAQRRVPQHLMRERARRRLELVI